MPSLGSLIQQPQSPQPPEQQGSSGTGEQPSLQGLMAQSGARPAQGQQQMGPPAPNHAQTVAGLRQIGFFQQRWGELLKDPDLGVKNVRPMILDVLADTLADGYASLPQSLNTMKTLPSDPLEQKQWLEKHYSDDEMAMTALLQHHAAANPGVSDWPTEQAKMTAQKPPDHLSMISALNAHYKAHTPKAPIGMPKSNASPLRQANA